MKSSSFAADVPFGAVSIGSSVDVIMLGLDDRANVDVSNIVVQPTVSDSVISAVTFFAGALVDCGDALLLLLLLLAIPCVDVATVDGDADTDGTVGGRLFPVVVNDGTGRFVTNGCCCCWPVVVMVLPRNMI